MSVVFSPFNDARGRFDIQFYLVAILFIFFRLGSGLSLSVGFGVKQNWTVWIFVLMGFR